MKTYSEYVEANLPASRLGLQSVAAVTDSEFPRNLLSETDPSLHELSYFVFLYNRSAYRQKRITASNFGLVLAAVKRKSYPPSLFKTLLGQYNLKQGSKACEIGEFSMSQEQSSSIRRAVCSFRTVACLVDLQMGQCLTTALWK
ncbi:unnamed protein product [Arctogadus glacialis]